MSWQHHDLGRPTDEGSITLASDADREVTVNVLNEAFAQGRLTADEHAGRVREAHAARTWRELGALTADLPGLAGSPHPAGATAPAAACVPQLNWCLLCALLILCPPVAIAWLIAAWHRSRAGQGHEVTAGARPVLAACGVAQAGDGWRAEDR